MIVIVVSPAIDEIIILDGFAGLILIIILFNFVNVEFVICGSSSHPWSINFIDRWASWYGLSSCSCVDRGTRNHIIHLALSSNGVWIDVDFGLVDRAHLIIMPRVIIVSGRSFMWRGRNRVVEEIGLIHVKADPIITAIRARKYMGLMIGSSSLIEIMGDELDDDHIVTNLNRME